MKNNYKRITAFVMMAVVAFGLITCKKEKIEVPTVKVNDGAITLNYTSAGVSAEVTDQGGAEVKSRGFVYGLSGGSFDTVFCGSGVGVYSAELNNLQPNTTYVYEAFAKNAGGFGTSGKVTFTTKDNEKPTVKTGEVENVGTTTASCGGNVTGDGGANITERGVCWSTNHNPSVSESHVSAGSGLGEYTCNMTNLSANTTYYVRAYAKNSKGVGYGEEKQFTTLDFDLPEVTTAPVTDITQTTAKCGGEVINDGGTNVTERGVCWSTSHNPTVNNHKVQAGEGMGGFTCNITGLNAHTTYYVRAYAINSKGPNYGEEVYFVTEANPPTVSTGSVTNITTTSAMGSGNVTNDGGSDVSERGLCWSTHHEPALNGTHVEAGDGTGEFTAAITNLTANTTYYVRAYAINGVEPAYGDEVEFTTLSISIPGVTTASVTNIGNTTATGGGNVISDGGAPVTERGICWSTNHNPTIGGSHDNSGTGMGEFTVNMTGLTPNTTYYVKAYAINSQGPAYGEEVSFKTSQTPTYTISVSANPTNGGTVTGGGTYQQGQSCKVSATKATGYNFLKWTENGTQVSTNTSYTFNVTDNRTLVAQFQAQSYTISASASPSNGGTVSGGGTYTYGQSCTLTANHATGYTFVKWTKNGTQVSTNASFTFPVTESASYVAHFQTNSYTISVSASPSSGGAPYVGNTPGTTSGTYTYGQSCTVHANPNSDYTFTNWTENGSVVSTSVNYTFTVNDSRNLVAHYTANPQTYTISVSASPSSGGAPYVGNTPGTTSGTYTYGQSCTVHANPNSDYTFTNWRENGSQVSTNANYTFTVTGNRTLVAHFTANPQNYTISVSANPSNGGSVSGGGTYQQGQSCTVHATANSGYTFTNWTENGSQVSNNANYTFTVMGNRTLVAHFQQQSYTISTNVNPSGSGSVTGGGTYYYGQSCTLIANANSGYTFIQWQDGSTSNPRTITVTGNATYTAYFNAQPQAPIGAINGLFSVSGTQQVWFSQGNLQYRASNNTWRFAESQLDYIGSNNANISPSYSGWIDLFGWGTGNNPTNSSTNSSNYSTFFDWGVNPISNGGNTANQWRTLNSDEWSFLLFNRTTNTGIRFAKATVNGVTGVIILPDNWSTSYYTLNSTNNTSATYSVNTISSASWTNNLEAHGAVFLPAAGLRWGTEVNHVGSSGKYWSSTPGSGSYSSSAVNLSFAGNVGGSMGVGIGTTRPAGCSVRLVSDE